MHDLRRYNVGHGHFGTLQAADIHPAPTSPYFPGEFAPDGSAISPGAADSTFLFPETPETPVASAKLKAIGPNPAGNTAGQREIEFQSMTPEEREEKKKQAPQQGMALDPGVWNFIYITRNQIKILAELAKIMIAQNWMTQEEADKWREINADCINRGQSQLSGGGAVLTFGPYRRSRTTFEVNEDKSTQFYRKIRIYASVFFQKPLDKDIPPAEPDAISEPDEEMLAFMAEFGGIEAYEEDEPPDYSKVWTDGEEDDNERAKWTRANVEQNPRDWFRQIKGDKKAAKREAKQTDAAARAEKFERKRLARQERDKARAGEERERQAALRAERDAQSKLTQKEHDVHMWAKMSVIAQVWKDGGRDKSSEIEVPGPLDKFRSIAKKATFKQWVLNGKQDVKLTPESISKQKLQNAAQKLVRGDGKATGADSPPSES